MSETKELKDIYTPLFEYVVVEFNIPEKTKGGVILSDKAMQELQQKESPVMKVVAIGKEVKTVNVGDWILPSPSFRPMQVPLLYKNAKGGLQHAQIHISEVMGVVDSEFAQLKPVTKEAVN